MTISVNCKIDAFANHISYVLDFLNAHPLTPKGTTVVLNESSAKLQIGYGSGDEQDYKIPRQAKLFSQTIMRNEDLCCNEYSSDKGRVFSVEAIKKEASPFHRNRTLGFDIIEAIFFHISRYEEYHCEQTKKDKWDMMWEDQQFLVREKLNHIPVVDQLVFGFFSALGLEPMQRKTTFSLSHDIDVIQKYKNPYRMMRSSVRAFLDNGLSGFRNHLSDIISTKRKVQKDPYDTFDFLLIDSTTNQFTEQVLYVMAGGKTRKDNHYHINNQNIKSVIEDAQSFGYEIGLHGSYVTHQDGAQYKKEKADLAKATHKKIQYNRQHYLHFDFSYTPQILEDAGIEIDSSLGYQRLIGFRCGTGFPYRLFDFDRKQAFSWREHPMVIMDGALLTEASSHMQEANEILDSFIEKNQWNTHVNFNIHNSIFDPSKRNVEEMKLLYMKMISVAKPS